MQNRTPTRPVIPAFTPVPRKYRHDGWTAECQKAFIDALAETGSVKAAAPGTKHPDTHSLRFRVAWRPSER